MASLQEMIHKLEAGPWIRYLKIGLAALALVGLVLGYNWRSFRNFGTQEAMDTAQLARNLAQGKGYTTLFVRPLSLYLVKQRSAARNQEGSANGQSDPAQIKGNHPDLANPPVYPALLAAVMKVVPMKWTIDSTKASQDGRSWRYQPDFVISMFNEMIFLAVIVLTSLLARRLFDPGVAWLSGLLLLGSELLWRFSISGLSTMLLMLLFVALAWCLVLVEQEAREPKGGSRKLFLLAATAGALVGLGMLTRYSFGWLILPVGIYLILFGGPRKTALCLLTVAMLLVVVAPWVYRNVKVSGLPFGTATFAVLEGPFTFPEHQLARSLTPDFRTGFFVSLMWKLLGNSRALLQSELPRLGGSWLTPLFLAGLLLGFRNLGIRRLRYFLMMSLATLIVVQALGRTQLTEDSPEVNSENLLVLLVPLVFVYGVSLFYLMLDQMNLAFRGLRFIIVGAFGVVMILPMLFAFLPPKLTAVVYPPYYPPQIHLFSNLMKESELMMSDIPWAVAWYGQRQCIWLTLDANDSFFAVNDYLKTVNGLYLTPQTADSRALTEWHRAGEHSWGSFMLNCMFARQPPPKFPLRGLVAALLPEQLFLTDQKRLEVKTPVTGAPAKPAGAEKPAGREKPAE